MKTEFLIANKKKKKKEDKLLDLELKAVAPNRCFVLSCLNQHPVLSDLPINTRILSKYDNTEKREL